jgi:hypothetical protein
MADNNYQGQERRNSFRLTFPPDQSPRIKINGMNYAVIDMAENGIRFYNPLHQRMPEGPLAAQVEFQDGEQIKVTARVLRYEPLMVTVFLNQGIPLQRMLAEQIHIQKTSPK